MVRESEPDESLSKVLMLKQVAVYRELLKTISRSANGTIIWGVIMMALWIFVYARNGLPNWGKLPIAAYVHLTIALIELTTGLWKKIAPSPLAILIDAGLLLGFAGLNGYYAFEQYQRFRRIDSISVFLVIMMLYQALQQFRNWQLVNRSLLVKPNREQLRWFDDLVRDVKTADPEADETALHLKTRPEWKAKLLGDLGFFVSARGKVKVLHPSEVVLMVDPSNHDEEGHRTALLILQGDQLGPFRIDERNETNYLRWNAQ